MRWATRLRGTPRFGKKNCDVTAFTEDYLRGRPNREVSQSNKPITRHDQTRDYKNTMVGNVVDARRRSTRTASSGVQLYDVATFLPV